MQFNLFYRRIFLFNSL